MYAHWSAIALKSPAQYYARPPYAIKTALTHQGMDSTRLKE